MTDFYTELYSSYKVSPDSDKFVCKKLPVLSGPNYFVIFECEQFLVKKKGNKAGDSGVQ